MRQISRFIFGFGVLALIICPVKFTTDKARHLALAREQTPTPNRAAFESNGVPPSTDSHQLPPDIATHGSLVRAAQSLGAYETGWFEARAKFTVMIAGYPALAPNRLEIEIRNRSGASQILRYAGANPAETWQAWDITLPADAATVRLRAVAGATVTPGWLAFSEPFFIKALPEWQAWALLQLGATVCLALTLLHGPGLLWLRHRAPDATNIALALLVGPLLLAGLGLACWALGGSLEPAATARVGIILILLAIGWQSRRTRFASPLPREFAAVVAAGALLAGFAVAKGNLSTGPEGELYGGLISHTLEIGGQSDSRIPFHIVQVVAHHLGPFSPQAEAYFGPWSFASRGPLAGFIAAPVVLATGAAVPRDMPDQPWIPFDAGGFAVYRITLVVLASLASWAVFGVTSTLATPAWALFATMLALLSPFFVHELFFTWSKLITGGLVVAAFGLVHARRAFAAGAVVGIAYLFHPLALLSAPFLAAWLFAREARWRRLVAPWWFSVGVMLAVVPWLAVGQLRLQGGGSQAVFLTYFRLADSQFATMATWWHSRWDNFANTFLPFYLLTADPAHDSLNSVYAPSDGWTRAELLYWNTLPFALGLPAFLLLGATTITACRRSAGAAFVTVIGPALLLIAYWGAAKTGLMRQCGHVLFLSVIVLGAWSLQRHAPIWRRTALKIFLHPACFAWRGAEIAVMAFGVTLLNRFPRWNGPFTWNDAASLAIAATCLVTAIILLAKAGAPLKSNVTSL